MSLKCRYAVFTRLKEDMNIILYRIEKGAVGRVADGSRIKDKSEKSTFV